MKPENKPKPAARDNARREDADGAGAKTPGTDMQPEDTGTADSGSAPASAVEGVMKQTSKTPAERGER